MASSTWRDWAHQPELLTAMWPRLVASHATPDILLALRGVTPGIRRIVLHDAPKAKLTMHLGAAMPPPAPLLHLRSCYRTKPTTLALLVGPQNAAQGQGGGLVGPHNAAQGEGEGLLTPQQASINVQYVLYSLAGCTVVTRLVLNRVLADSHLLEAVQGLPFLNDLELSHVTVPNLSNYAELCRYNLCRLPRGLRTLSVSVRQEEGDPDPAVIMWAGDDDEELGSRIARLLSPFLTLDTVTDLTVNSCEEDEPDQLQVALEALASRGVSTPALRTLTARLARLCNEDVRSLLSVAPHLEQVEVFRAELLGEETAKLEVTWRRLRVHDLDVGSLCGLPLAGADDLDIHVLGYLGHEFNGASLETLYDSMDHLTLDAEGKRRVRLVGSGKDGSSYTWDSEFESYTEDLSSVLPVLQISKVPVRRLDILNGGLIDVDHLTRALSPLQSITQLRLQPKGAGWLSPPPGGRVDMLLARLPLHIERVRLDMIPEHGINPFQRLINHLFSNMVIHASKVPGRQDRPLRLCIAGVGAGNEVWQEAVRCRALGDMGVVMEEVWE